MNFRTIILLNLLLFTLLPVPITVAQSGLCPDADVRNALDSSLTILGSPAVPADQVDRAEQILSDVRQRCYPDPFVLATNTPAPTLTPVPTATQAVDLTNISTYQYTLLYDTPDKSTKPVSVSSCTTLTIAGDPQGDVTPVVFVDNIRNSAVEYWVYADVFSKSFDFQPSLTLPLRDATTRAPLVDAYSPLYDGPTEDANQIATSIRDYATLTLLDGTVAPKQGAQASGDQQPKTVFRVHVLLDDQQDGWLQPRVLARAMIGQTVTTSYEEGTNYRRTPDTTDESYIGRWGVGEVLDILDTDDVTHQWWKVRWHRKAWVTTTDIAPRAFAVGNTVRVSGFDASQTVNVRKDHSFAAEVVGTVTPATAIKIDEISSDNGNNVWVRFSSASLAGWINSCVLNIPPPAAASS